MVKKIPTEIERLYNLGFAVHWLRPRSKVPVDSGWTSGPRTDLDQLKARYKPAFNVGVRLGTPSKVAGAYLAVLDVDVKSDDPKHADEARTKLFELFPEVEKGPYLLSGRGNGSAHYYVRLAEPLRGDDVKARSGDLVKVRMPSVSPSKREAEQLTDAEIAEGLRLRPAWEISLLCDGRQAAIVGSIHPDTGKRYRWGRTVNGSGKDIPLIGTKSPALARLTAGGDRMHLRGPEPKPTFDLTDVDLDDLPLTESQKAAVKDGIDVVDRSAKVFELCIALTSAKISDAQILSLMTDRRYYLGECAFDHAKTGDRQRAARWVEKYCLRKAKERAADTPFDIEEIPSDGELKAKRKEYDARRPRAEPKQRLFPPGFTGADWESEVEIKFMGANKPPLVKSTLANLVTIVENQAGVDCLRFEDFTQKIIWNRKTPWGAVPGQERSAGSEDAIAIKKWFADTYKIEPPNSVIDEALHVIARQNMHHVVKDFLEPLEWDGVERLNGAFKRYLGAYGMPEPYLSDVTRKFFLACVKRIYEPGCKFDHVVVLEGKQGVGKSSFGHILVGESWFMDGLPNFQDKDAALNLIGTWVCELGELATLYRSEENAAKSFITRCVDKVRPPYGHRRVDYPRRTVFLGTTDKRDYLTDSAGNRRYWPVRVTRCDFKALKADREQLWAEALWRYYFAPEPLYLTGKAKHQAVEVQELRRIEDEGDAIYDRLETWVNEQKPKGGAIEVKLPDLFSGPLFVLQANRQNTIRVGAVLRRMGFEKTHTKKGKIWVKRR